MYWKEMYTIHVAKHNPLVAVYFFAITPGWKQQKNIRKQKQQQQQQNGGVVLF